MPGVHTNADVRSRDLARVCCLTDSERDYIVSLIERLHLSARAYDKVLRVARTLADLDGREAVGREDVYNAVSYRRLDAEESRFWV